MSILEEFERRWRGSPEYRQIRHRFLTRVALPTMATCITVGALSAALSIWGPLAMLMQYGAAYVTGRVALRRLSTADLTLKAGDPDIQPDP